MTRKERRVQKALGLGRDIPPTYFERFKVWGWYNFCARRRLYFQEKFWRQLAFKLPKKLVYHCTIRTWVYATTCDEGKNECVCDTTVDNALRRWEHFK